MPVPEIDRLSPSEGWPGGTAPDGTPIDGTLVVIHGRYFHPTAEMDRNPKKQKRGQIFFSSAFRGLPCFLRSILLPIIFST